MMKFGQREFADTPDDVFWGDFQRLLPHLLRSDTTRSLLALLLIGLAPESSRAVPAHFGERPLNGATLACKFTVEPDPRWSQASASKPEIIIGVPKPPRTIQ